MYLLMKRGLYWRPNSQGYTGLKREAGRYTEEQAKAWADHDRTETKAIHENDAPRFAPECSADSRVKDLQDENERLRDWLREAVDDLKFIRDHSDNYINVEVYEKALGQ